MNSPVAKVSSLVFGASRSLVLRHGLDAGSVLPYFQHALDQNYRRIIANPTSTMTRDEQGQAMKKSYNMCGTHMLKPRLQNESIIVSGMLSGMVASWSNIYSQFEVKSLQNELERLQ